jgi:hypothetical protein
MLRFFGWLFIILAVLCFFSGLLNPESGAAGGIFNLLFWGFIGLLLLKRAKKKNKEAATKEAVAPFAANKNRTQNHPVDAVSPVKTVRFTCKSCGAKNEVPATGNAIRCEYCGTSSIPPIPSGERTDFDQVASDMLDKLLE